MRHKYLLLLFVLTFIHLQMNAQSPAAGHYAPVNGLKLYYELHGSGTPLVLLHGGGSTIQSTYGRVLPALAKKHRVIAIELQAHGHTADIDRPLSFEQDADDVATLLKQLHISKASIMGFSNGGTTALQMAMRHPEAVDKLVLIAALYNRSGVPPGFFEGFPNATLEQMPKPLQEAYLAVNPDPKGLQAMFHRDATRMAEFKDIPDTAIKSIQAPALVVNGDTEVILAAHAMALSHLLPHARLAILPGGHGEYIGEVCAPDKKSIMPEVTTAIILEFLAK